MSAIDLEEAMVLSPTREMELFIARGDNDIVVYFDQSTANLEKRSNLLTILFLALENFSYSKPTKRPPILLEGGVDAWVDHFGHQSLKVEDKTQQVTPNNQYRNSTEISRFQRMPVSSSNLPYPSSPTGEQSAFRPIDLDEEKRWVEQLSKENDRPRLDIVRASNANTADPIIRTVEEFVR